jgi:hypothetical protein
MVGTATQISIYTFKACNGINCFIYGTVGRAKCPIHAVKAQRKQRYGYVHSQFQL